ncbi:hypothetical protein F4775DRAFT_602036 [Biscogniauxia sp. FL1348]|nr:hypothetical protein F4775DRAFT_602036 [Biscogniauxia sp. FL1348]
MNSRDVEDFVGDGDLNNFSCYITINNLSNEDLGLGDFGINGRYGEWPEGMPLNTIDAHTSPQIQFKDPKKYEILTGDSPPRFRLEFSCPETPFSKNYLRAKTSNPDPVHETIAIAAFILSKKPLPKGTTYHNLNDKQWEYFRGAWYSDFETGPPSYMIRRFHFGDLQFLHAMGGTDGELPAETQRKILRWFEVMYKLACGDQGVSDTDQLRQSSGECTPNYYKPDIQRRALGICLHMITDSYANPESYRGRDDDGYMVFQPGAWGAWGAVINFHCYAGQNSDLHAHYDGLEGKPLPVPKNLESLNSIIGARNAIEGCKKLISFWTFLRTDIFAIDKDASPSNSQVDQSGPITSSCCHFAGRNLDTEYQTGLQSKLTSLDTRVPATGSDLAKIRRYPTLRAAVFTVSALAFGVTLALLGHRVYRPL